MSRAAWRSASNSGSRSATSRRRAMKLTSTNFSAFCSSGSASAALALSVARRDRLAVALQLARHVHQTAEIPGEQHGGAGRRGVRRLLLDDRVGDVRILDAEGAAEPAADVGIAHLRERESAHRAKQPARLDAHAALAQARAAVGTGG